MNTPIRSLRLPDELWQWLSQHATALGKSRSYVVVSIIREFAKNDIDPASFQRFTAQASKETDP